MIRLVYAISIFFIILSCGRDLDPLVKSYDDVDEVLWSYFEDFEIEAARRGVNIDLNALGISGEIRNIAEENVAGTCQYGQHLHHVTIDRQFWNNASPLFREYIIFHELGHCSLFRDHTESQFSNGRCASIMASGLGDCSIGYTQESRDYYLDELFGAL